MSRWCSCIDWCGELRRWVFLVAALARPVTAVAQTSLDTLKRQRIAAFEALLAFHPALLSNDARIAACGMLAPDSVRGTPGLSEPYQARAAYVKPPYTAASCEAIGFLHYGKQLVLVHEAAVVDTTLGQSDLRARFVDFQVEHLRGLEHSDFSAYRARQWAMPEWKVVSYRYITTAFDTYGLLYRVIQDSTGKFVWGPGGPPPKRVN